MQTRKVKDGLVQLIHPNSFDGQRMSFVGKRASMVAQLHPVFCVWNILARWDSE